MNTIAKRIVTPALIICFVMAMSATAFAASFTDVSESHWSYQYVEKAYANGLINGTGNGQYAPDKDVTNAE